jgi:hypothetical protein
MMRAVEDLLNARPHMRTSARFTVAELRVYHEAYYTALVFALRVMVEAVANYRAVTQTRRADSRAKRSA